MYYHTLQVLGRATADAELQTSKKGKNFCRFSVAVNQKDGKEKNKEKTFFYEIVLFGKRAENAAKLVKKADLIFAYGRPELEAYLTKGKSKEAKISLKILADDWQVLK